MKITTVFICILAILFNYNEIQKYKFQKFQILKTYYLILLSNYVNFKNQNHFLWNITTVYLFG